MRGDPESSGRMIEAVDFNLAVRQQAVISVLPSRYGDKPPVPSGCFEAAFMGGVDMAAEDKIGAHGDFAFYRRIRKKRAGIVVMAGARFGVLCARRQKGRKGPGHVFHRGSADWSGQQPAERLKHLLIGAEGIAVNAGYAFSVCVKSIARAMRFYAEIYQPRDGEAGTEAKKSRETRAGIEAQPFADGEIAIAADVMDVHPPFGRRFEQTQRSVIVANDKTSTLEPEVEGIAEKHDRLRSPLHGGEESGEPFVIPDRPFPNSGVLHVERAQVHVGDQERGCVLSVEDLGHNGFPFFNGNFS